MRPHRSPVLREIGRSPTRDLPSSAMLSASLVLLLPSAAGFCPPGIIAAHPLTHARIEAPIVGRLGGEAISRRHLGAVAAAAVLLPQQARAESTLVTRQQSYTRYVPRVERGRDYWAGGLRKLIASSDWKGLSAALEKKVLAATCGSHDGRLRSLFYRRPARNMKFYNDAIARHGRGGAISVCPSRPLCVLPPARLAHHDSRLPALLRRARSTGSSARWSCGLPHSRVRRSPPRRSP